jgi:hypothetical protein
MIDLFQRRQPAETQAIGSNWLAFNGGNNCFHSWQPSKELLWTSKIEVGNTRINRKEDRQWIGLGVWHG